MFPLSGLGEIEVDMLGVHSKEPIAHPIKRHRTNGMCEIERLRKWTGVTVKQQTMFFFMSLLLQEKARKTTKNARSCLPGQTPKAFGKEGKMVSEKRTGNMASREPLQASN